MGPPLGFFSGTLALIYSHVQSKLCGSTLSILSMHVPTELAMSFCRIAPWTRIWEGINRPFGTQQNNVMLMNGTTKVSIVSLNHISLSLFDWCIVARPCLTGSRISLSLERWRARMSSVRAVSGGPALPQPVGRYESAECMFSCRRSILASVL